MNLPIEFWTASGAVALLGLATLRVMRRRRKQPVAEVAESVEAHPDDFPLPLPIHAPVITMTTTKKDKPSAHDEPCPVPRCRAVGAHGHADGVLKAAIAAKQAADAEAATVKK